MVNKRSDDEKQKLKHKCLECGHVPCINFYARSAKPFEGGEIYVLQSLIKEKMSFPCEIGALIYSLCKLSSPLGDFPSSEMFAQCIRDLRASAYLLLSCHYRSSIQLLRPVVENYIAGIYWDVKFLITNQNEKELEEVEKDYFDFLKDEYEIPTTEWYEIFPKDKKRRPKKKLDADFCLSWMVKKGDTNNKFKNDITQLVSEFNKYLHPRGLKYTEAEKTDCPDCFSFVRYQEDEFRQCTRLFQDVAFLLISVCYKYISAYFPDRIDSEEITDAIGFLKVLDGVEKEFNRQLIFSEKLKAFVSHFRFID